MFTLLDDIARSLANQ